jgi:hypothetical protein
MNFKIKTYVLPKARFRLKGERTLTSSSKENEKKKRGYKCDRCHKKFPSYLLKVHHKREVFKSKSKAMVELPRLEITHAKKSTYHDRPQNLQVLCGTCHDKEHHKRSLDHKKKKRRAPNPYGLPF